MYRSPIIIVSGLKDNVARLGDSVKEVVHEFQLAESLSKQCVWKWQSSTSSLTALPLRVSQEIEKEFQVCNIEHFSNTRLNLSVIAWRCYVNMKASVAFCTLLIFELAFWRRSRPAKSAAVSKRVRPRKVISWAASANNLHKVDAVKHKAHN